MNFRILSRYPRTVYRKGITRSARRSTIPPPEHTTIHSRAGSDSIEKRKRKANFAS